VSEKAAPKTPKRGEAAWKEHKDQVAERNEKVSAAGREQRQAYENEKAAARQAADVRRLSAVRGGKSK
jgi:hypothetical protein